MIVTHDFNSAWRGVPVGAVSDPAFFEKSLAERRILLERYAWVELLLPVSAMPDRRHLAATGFFFTDLRVRFRLSLKGIAPSDCARSLDVERAAELKILPLAADTRPFAHERFYAVPGVTEAMVTERYLGWAGDICRQAPATCLRFSLEGAVQGWFFARPQPEGLELTLTMLSAAAKISGYDLYAAAMVAYARQGFRMGFAGFSASNTAVMNIYAKLGARFLEPLESWLWLRHE